MGAQGKGVIGAWINSYGAWRLGGASLGFDAMRSLNVSRYLFEVFPITSL